jgi:hypothetical protein
MLRQLHKWRYPVPNLLPDLSRISSDVLVARLAALLKGEREAMTNFLLHLAEVDRRRLHLELGYPSLFDYLVRAHGFSKGAAFRRMTGARLLRRYPQAAAMLRDGRLSLTTLAALRDVLDEAQADALLGRACGRTKEEVEAIVAALRPRPAPRDAIRPLPAPRTVLLPAELVPAALVSAACASSPPPGVSHELAARRTDRPRLVPVTLPRISPPTVEAITAELRVLRLTVTTQFLAELEEVKAALAHRYPEGRMADLLGECMKVFLAEQARRTGRGPRPVPGTARSPATRAAASSAAGRPRPPAPATAAMEAPPGRVAPAVAAVAAISSVEEPPAVAAYLPPPESPLVPAAGPAPRGLPRQAMGRTRHIPRAVLRAVWERDGGRCTFRGPGGTVCGSRHRLEMDHVEPWALGGENTVANLTLRCKVHNLLRARQTFGSLVPEGTGRSRGRFAGELTGGRPRRGAPARGGAPAG